VRRPGWVVWSLVAAVLIVMVASVVLAATWTSHPRNLPGPYLAAPPPLQFGQPVLGYAGHWIWYNFSISRVSGNLSWNETRAFVDPGPYTPPDSNSTLGVRNHSGALIAPFVWAAGNWTTTSRASVDIGQVISLKVDRPPTLEGFGIGWAGPPEGAFLVSSLP
jgi:hypothetical protein